MELSHPRIIQTTVLTFNPVYLKSKEVLFTRKNRLDKSGRLLQIPEGQYCGGLSLVYYRQRGEMIVLTCFSFLAHKHLKKNGRHFTVNDYHV